MPQRIRLTIGRADQRGHPVADPRGNGTRNSLWGIDGLGMPNTSSGEILLPDATQAGEISAETKALGKPIAAGGFVGGVTNAAMPELHATARPRA